MVAFESLSIVVVLWSSVSQIENENDDVVIWKLFGISRRKKIF